MKKKYLISCIIALLMTIGTFQSAYSQIRLGVRGGFDVADHKITTDILNVSNRRGYQIGPTLEVPIPLVGFAIDASLLYGRKEFKIEEKKTQADISNYDYLTLPISLKKRFDINSDFGIFVSAGGFATVKLNGGDLKLAKEEFMSKDFAFGVNAGAGVRLFKNFDLGLYFRSQLTENYSSENIDVKKISEKKFQTWNVALTYYL